MGNLGMLRVNFLFVCVFTYNPGSLELTSFEKFVQLFLCLRKS